MEFQSTTEICEVGLASNLQGVLVAGTLEIAQSAWDLMNNTLLFLAPWNWFGSWGGLLRLDLGDTYAYYGLTKVTRSKANLDCITNTIEDLSKPTKKSYYYFSEMQYYLAALKATQDLYLAFHKMDIINIVPVFAAAEAIGQIAMAAMAMSLQVDASEVAPYQKYVEPKFTGGGKSQTPEPAPSPNPKVDPTKPVGPEQPVDPAKPVDPAEPEVNPSGPVDPSKNG